MPYSCTYGGRLLVTELWTTGLGKSLATSYDMGYSGPILSPSTSSEPTLSTAPYCAGYYIGRKESWKEGGLTGLTTRKVK